MVTRGSNTNTPCISPLVKTKRTRIKIFLSRQQSPSPEFFHHKLNDVPQMALLVGPTRVSSLDVHRGHSHVLKMWTTLLLFWQ